MNCSEFSPACSFHCRHFLEVFCHFSLQCLGSRSGTNVETSNTFSACLAWTFCWLCQTGPAVLRVPEEAMAWELSVEPFGYILGLCLLAWWQWPEGRAMSEGRPCWGVRFWAEDSDGRLPSHVLLLLGWGCLYWALETRAILLSWHLEAFQRKEQTGFLNFTVGLREREELLWILEPTQTVRIAHKENEQKTHFDSSVTCWKTNCHIPFLFL